MIIDQQPKFAKNIYVTEQIISFEIQPPRCRVVYQNNKEYFPRLSRFIYMDKPTRINLDEFHIYIEGRKATDVKEAYRFEDGAGHQYYHLIREKRSINLQGKDVYLSKGIINKSNIDTWDYLMNCARETMIKGEKNDTLIKEYEKVDLHRDNVPLAQYLGIKKGLNTFKLPSYVIYPFGCNSSQKQAVENALTHQFSIIQGPPGTGKTQTILNIIANLIIQGKTILVVSNNNSAVENVRDKMKEANLDFLVALLGKKNNVTNFLDNQPPYPSMEGWTTANVRETRRKVNELLSKATEGFSAKEVLADLRRDYDALLKEMEYHKLQNKITKSPSWLSRLSSGRLMDMLQRLMRMNETDQRMTFFTRLLLGLRYHPMMFFLLRRPLSDILPEVELNYYYRRESEIKQKIEDIESTLLELNIEELLQNLKDESMRILKHHIASCTMWDSPRHQFEKGDTWKKAREFLKEYPVVLSTTFSARNTISPSMIYDYVIMDEASQVSITHGAISLSCAKNAVIVGDIKQLGNINDEETSNKYRVIESSYQLDDIYNNLKFNFLRSCMQAFPDAPSTLLREHYRCHPRIIDFCNRMFYDNQLKIMTMDHGEKDVMQVIRTVKGNHCRDHRNEREKDEIVNLVPTFSDKSSFGIITPYENQYKIINEALGNENAAATIDKFQGRECDNIIIGMTGNRITTFNDESSRLNVAVSRAKKRLILVVTGNDIDPKSNVGQLIDYIKYNNFDVKESKLYSIFDILYSQYTEERIKYLKDKKLFSNVLSEQVLYDTLMKAFEELSITHLGVVGQYPLSKLIADRSLLDEEENKFVNDKHSHVDMLIYNKVTKQPYMVIEVDGYNYHKCNVVQQERDALKDRLLSKYGLCPKRFETDKIVTVETIKKLFV